MAIKQQLRPYQVEVGQAVVRSVLERRGLTFTVEVARQGGKNELSAQMELLLLTRYMAQAGNLVKAAPTYMPQLINSILRLRDRLNDAGYAGLWSPQAGNSIRLGKARQIFLSAEPSARVVGATAHILLEMDEAQEIDKEKFYKKFRPMGASTNVTTVLYGTPWDSDSLLEEQKQQNLEQQRRDGVRRHFQYDWGEVARHNPLYHTYVEGGASVWERTTRCSKASTCYCPSVALADSSAAHSGRSSRATTRVCMSLNRAGPMSPVWTWQAAVAMAPLPSSAIATPAATPPY